MNLKAQVFNIAQSHLKATLNPTNPAFQAQWDFNREGCNCNPFPKDSEQWQVYEQTFDNCEIDELKRG